MFEAEGPPVSLSVYTRFVVTIPCFVGVMHGGMRGGVRLAMAREKATTEICF